MSCGGLNQPSFAGHYVEYDRLRWSHRLKSPITWSRRAYYLPYTSHLTYPVDHNVVTGVARSDHYRSSFRPPLLPKLIVSVFKKRMHGQPIASIGGAARPMHARLGLEVRTQSGTNGDVAGPSTDGLRWSDSTVIPARQHHSYSIMIGSEAHNFVYPTN